MQADIQEVYQEDTIGRKYYTPIVSKKNTYSKPPKPAQVSTFNFNKPMSRDEFLKLDKSLQVMYIKYLNEQYGATAVQISEMLGYSVKLFRDKVMNPLGLKGCFKRGGRMSKEKMDRWQSFLGDKQESATKPKESKPKKKQTKKQSTPQNKKTEPNTVMSPVSCSFIVKGKLKADEIARRISVLVSDGTECEINVQVDVLNALAERA